MEEPDGMGGLRGASGGSGNSLLGWYGGRLERLDEQCRAQQRLLSDDEQGMRRKKDTRWSADCKGFSLHAGVCFGALDHRPHPGLASCDRFGARPVGRREVS